MFHQIDRNRDGKITFNELLIVTFPLATPEQIRVWRMLLLLPLGL